LIGSRDAPKLQERGSNSPTLKFQTFTLDYVRRLIDGDQATEQHFVTYFSELLRIKLSRLLRDRHAVEDARQETFLRVLNILRRKNGLSEPEKLGAFVNGVCTNVVAEYFRAAARHPQSPSAEFDLVASSPNPEADVVDEERRRNIRQILESLPPRDQQILRLLFLEEMEKDEVCRVCQVDRSYLRVLLHRAKNRFREGAWGRGASSGL
jgi:RNA polymerase sigma-70 factor, ECF subfamily